MFRKQFLEASVNTKPKHAHLRHLRHSREVSRLEGISDGVFALALTLLIVSQQVPERFDELQALMGGLVPFALCFAFLMSIWYNHFVFFRRYPLEDATTVALNSVLLFVVLFSIYPFKFTANWIVKVLANQSGAVQRSRGVFDYTAIRHEQIPILLLYYMIAFGAVSLSFLLLHLHAWHKREVLQLNRMEEFEVRASAGTHAQMLSLSVVGTTLMPLVMRYSGRGLLIWLVLYMVVVLGVMWLQQRVKSRRKTLLAAFQRETAIGSA